MMPSGLSRPYRNGEHKDGHIVWPPPYMAQEVKGVSRTITKYGSVPKAGIRGIAPPPAMNNPNILRRVARACGRDAR
jgi:hypothetical protein